jgi:hypothetical protein
VTAPRRAALALALVAAGACGPAPREAAPAPVAVDAPPAPAPARVQVPTPDASTTVAPTDEELVGEAPEANPTSETVTIKLVAEASRKARVSWGRKDLGFAPLEIQRPRGSGPLDLLVVAPGALPLHTRVFTDRDDKLALRLYPESDAPSLLGYRPPVETPSKTPSTTPTKGASPVKRKSR